MLFKRPYTEQSHIFSEFENGLAEVINYKDWNIVGYAEDYATFINPKGETVLLDSLTLYRRRFPNSRIFVDNAHENYRIIDTSYYLNDQDTFGIFDNFQRKWGIVDLNGKIVVDLKYDQIFEVEGLYNLFIYEIDEIDGWNRKIRYGIINMKSKTISDPIIKDYDQSGYINGLLKARIDEKLSYYDKEGKIVWQEKKDTIKALKTLNIDFMYPGYFYAFPTPHNKNLRGYDSSYNFPQKIDSNTNSQTKELSIIVNPEMQDTFKNIYTGYKVYVANNSIKDIDFNTQDKRLEMNVQAQNQIGQWRDIEYLQGSFCGVSDYSIRLETNYFWTFITPKYEGELKTKLRVKLKYIDPTDKSEVKAENKREITIYSNEYDGSINLGQFWNLKEFNPNDIIYTDRY